MAYNREQYVVRCRKCVIGHDKAGKPVGGVLSRINATTAQCCACGKRYKVVAKPYNADKYHEQGEVTL